MPVYLYRCDTCGARFEKEESMLSEPSVICANSNCSGKVERLIGRVGISFKGSGFYSTDNPKST